MLEGEEIESFNGVNSLPRAMIQRIQSSLTSKEATQTLNLSKSWLNAGLTRPDLEFDESNFQSEHIFRHHVYQTMQRYRDSNIKINSFTLRTGIWLHSKLRTRSWFYPDDDDDDYNNTNNNDEFVAEIILEALKMGPTYLNLDSFLSFDLPRGVLDSETLIGLSLIGWTFPEPWIGNINLPNLNSLTLCEVRASEDVIKKILSSCPSLEKLSLSGFTMEFSTDWSMPNLKSLFLERMYISSHVFDDFSTIFPSLKEMAIHDCTFERRLRRVYSPSLERMRLTLTSQTRTSTPVFDFPNIRKFEISCKSLLKIDVKPPSSEWECRISMDLGEYISDHKKLIDPLRTLLTKWGSCKISLSLTSDSTRSYNFARDRVPRLRYAKPLPQLGIEDLTIIDLPSSFRPAHLRGLLMNFRPNVINLSSVDGRLLKIVCWRLMTGPYLPSKIEVEYFDEALNLWQPLEFKALKLALLKKTLHLWPPLARKLKHKIRFQLRWE